MSGARSHTPGFLRRKRVGSDQSSDPQHTNRWTRKLPFVGRQTLPNVQPPTDANRYYSSIPDPFAAVLPAIAALGAISSIASMSWTADDVGASGPSKSRRKALKALGDLEDVSHGLAEIFRRFAQNPRLFAGSSGGALSPLKFGVHGPRISADEVRIYQQLINDMASLLVAATQSSHAVMSSIESGTITAPDDIFFAFGEAQDRLNRLIQDRATLNEAVTVGGEIAVQMAKLIRDLQDHTLE